SRPCAPWWCRVGEERRAAFASPVVEERRAGFAPPVVEERRAGFAPPVVEERRAASRLETPTHTPRRSDLRLLPAALSAWATGGVLFGLAPDAPLGVVAAILWAAAALSVVAASGLRFLAAASIALAAAALVATVVAAQAPARAPSAFVDVAGGASVELDVTAT